MIPLAITPGDPGGIGPDLCIQAAIDGELEGILIADPEILQRRAEVLGLPVSIMDAIILSERKGLSMLNRWQPQTQPMPQGFPIRSMRGIA